MTANPDRIIESRVFLRDVGGQDTTHFEIVSGEGPQGITSELLHDLFQTAAYWGWEQTDADGYDWVMLSGDEGAPFVKIMDNRAGQGNGTMTVSLNLPSRIAESPKFFQLKNGVFVIWDGGVSIEDAKNFTAYVDELATQSGRYVNGVRDQVSVDNWNERQ